MNLSLDRSGACDIEDPKNEERLDATVLAASEFYPLVGLHGHYSASKERIMDLGVIWFNAKDNKCRQNDLDNWDLDPRMP